MIGAWDYDDGLDDYGLDDYYAERESFDAHYGDEIDGRCVTPVDDAPSVSATAITNAPGQLRFSL